MSSFSSKQIRELTEKLDRQHVRTRTVGGRDIS